MQGFERHVSKEINKSVTVKKIEKNYFKKRWNSIVKWFNIVIFLNFLLFRTQIKCFNGQMC